MSSTPTDKVQLLKSESARSSASPENNSNPSRLSQSLEDNYINVLFESTSERAMSSASSTHRGISPQFFDHNDKSRSNSMSEDAMPSASNAHKAIPAQSLDDPTINVPLDSVHEDAVPSTSNAHRENSPKKCTGCCDRDCNTCFPYQYLDSCDSDLEFEPQPFVPQPANHTSEVPFCTLHPDTEELYCRTCNRMLCENCNSQQHKDHITEKLAKTIDDAKDKVLKALDKVSDEMAEITREQADLETLTNVITKEMKKAEEEVLSSINKATTIIEERQKQLLDDIEKTKQERLADLQWIRNTLNNKIAHLSTFFDALMKNVNAPPGEVNPAELSILTDMAEAEVRAYDESSPLYSPRESALQTHIDFSDVESDPSTAVRSFGGSSVSTEMGAVGDSRQELDYFTTSSDEHRTRLRYPSNPYPDDTELTPTQQFYPAVVRSYWQKHATKPSQIIGTGGEVLDNLCRPWGIACDKEGHIIVADRSNNRIQIYKLDGSFVRRFGSVGTARGQFQLPTGVAVDNRRRIIVADKDNHRVQIFTMEGKFILAFGRKGRRFGQFHYPWDVAANAECQIAVSDTRNHRVQLFSAEGIAIRTYGSAMKWKILDSPRGVAFDELGNVVVTDFNHHKVLTIDKKFERPTVFKCESTDTSRPFRRPQGIVVDDQGNVIVADSKRHRIQIYNIYGIHKWQYGNYGSGESEMDRPAGVALCPDGRIAVVDFGNNRVLLI